MKWAKIRKKCKLGKPQAKIEIFRKNFEWSDPEGISAECRKKISKNIDFNLCVNRVYNYTHL